MDKELKEQNALVAEKLYGFKVEDWGLKGYQIEVGQNTYDDLPNYMEGEDMDTWMKRLTNKGFDIDVSINGKDITVKFTKDGKETTVNHNFKLEERSIPELLVEGALKAVGAKKDDKPEILDGYEVDLERRMKEADDSDSGDTGAESEEK